LPSFLAFSSFSSFSFLAFSSRPFLAISASKEFPVIGGGGVHGIGSSGAFDDSIEAV
jgi:hypothetical protein